ncbi:MAG: hypothetical protein RPS47_08885, partial [Colwellia sp.]
HESLNRPETRIFKWLGYIMRLVRFNENNAFELNKFKGVLLISVSLLRWSTLIHSRNDHTVNEIGIRYRNLNDTF